MRLALVFSFMVPIALAACGSSDDNPYATFQECVMDHSVNDGLTEPQAVATCLLNHFGLHFDTVADCMAYLADHGGYPDSAVEACQTYFDQR